MPHQVIYPPAGKEHTVVKVMGYLSALALILTVAAAAYGWVYIDATILYILAVIWAIAPPVWFWYEYFYLYRVGGDADGFEHFKHGQQVSVAIWAGVALTLFALVSSERLKPVNSCDKALTEKLCEKIQVEKACDKTQLERPLRQGTTIIVN